MIEVKVKCDKCKKECVGDEYYSVEINIVKTRVSKINRPTTTYSHLCPICVDVLFGKGSLTDGRVLKGLL